MEWHPIETAPKNEAILILEEAGGMVVGLYDCEMWWEAQMEYALTNPTWWMYLPDRPDLPMGWQPIETAPKDGTPIDVWLGDASESDLDFYCCPGTKRSPAWSYKQGRFRPLGGLPTVVTTFVEPTHWQPLPDPPKDK